MSKRTPRLLVVGSATRQPASPGPSRREVLQAGAATLAFGAIQLRWPAVAGAQ